MTIIASLRRLLLPGLLGALVLTMATSAQSPKEEFIPKPDALEVHGVPPIPASLAKDVAKYTAPYGYTLAGWDPVKREVRVKLLGGGPAIYRIDEPGGRLRLWKQLFVSPVYDVYIDPKDTCLIYNKDADGNEAFQMYLFDFKTFKTTLLSDPGSRNTEFVWSHAGDRVVYSRSKASEGPGVSLYVMDPRDPKTNRLLFKSEGNYIKAYDWSPDDRMITVCEFYSQSDSRLWVLDVDSGKKTLLSTSGKFPEYYGWPRFSRDGKRVYVITDYRSKVRRLASVEINTGVFAYLTRDNSWEVDGFSVSPDGLLIAYTINEDGYSRLFILDVVANKSEAIVGLPIGIISGITWHNNSGDLAFNLKSSKIPNDVYSVNIESKVGELWSKSVMGKLDSEEIIAPQLIRWRSFDGRQIPGFIYRPPAQFKGKRPVILYLHGGPTDQYRPRFNYEHNYYLKEMGVAWIYPNFRGSTGYGKDYLHSDNGLKREVAAKDVEALLMWIKAQPDLDSQRVMVHGASYGGYLALSVAYRIGSQVACVRVDAGFSNIATLIEKIDISRRELQRGEFGDERNAELRSYMNRIAPLSHASEIKSPVLIIHGVNDQVASIESVKDIASLIVQNNIPLWSIWAGKEGHDVSDYLSWNYQLYSGMVFAKWCLLEK